MFLIHSNAIHLNTAKQCKAKPGLRAISFINFVFTPEAVNYIFLGAKDLKPQNIYTWAKHRTSTLYRDCIVQKHTSQPHEVRDFLLSSVQKPI